MSIVDPAGACSSNLTPSKPWKWAAGRGGGERVGGWIRGQGRRSELRAATSARVVSFPQGGFTRAARIVHTASTLRAQAGAACLMHTWSAVQAHLMAT